MPPSLHESTVSLPVSYHLLWECSGQSEKVTGDLDKPYALKVRSSINLKKLLNVYMCRNKKIGIALIELGWLEIPSERTCCVFEMPKSVQAPTKNKLIFKKGNSHLFAHTPACSTTFKAFTSVPLCRFGFCYGLVISHAPLSIHSLLSSENPMNTDGARQQAR